MCRLVVQSELDADWKSCCCPISNNSAIYLSTSTTPTTGSTPNPVPSTSDFPSPSQCSLDVPPALRGLFQPCRQHSNFYMISCQFDPDHKSHKKLPYHKTIATEDISDMADVLRPCRRDGRKLRVDRMEEAEVREDVCRRMDGEKMEGNGDGRSVEESRGRESDGDSEGRGRG